MTTRYSTLGVKVRLYEGGRVERGMLGDGAARGATPAPPRAILSLKILPPSPPHPPTLLPSSSSGTPRANTRTPVAAAASRRRPKRYTVAFQPGRGYSTDRRSVLRSYS